MTEIFVYRLKNNDEGRVKRLGLFFAMNMVALLLRAPIIYIMTTLLGIYYIISNLTTLVILTSLRFLLADNVIWGRASAKSPVGHLEFKIRRNTMKNTYSYNIHNLVTVLSEGELPELEPFKVRDTIQEPTIHVRVGKPRSSNNGKDQGQYLRFREVFGYLGFDVGIELSEPIDVVVSPALRRSPHVLYTNVIEPLLRWTFVTEGICLGAWRYNCFQ